MKAYDAIVIGAGHNGLTNAAYLAKSGLNVLCLEKNDYICGATVSRNLHKDWFYSNCSYVCSLLRPEIYREALRQLSPGGPGSGPEPAEVLFVGDSPSCDVAGPARCGMQTALLVHPDVERLWPESEYQAASPTYRLARLKELEDVL